MAKETPEETQGRLITHYDSIHVRRTNKYQQQLQVEHQVRTIQIHHVVLPATIHATLKGIQR